MESSTQNNEHENGVSNHSHSEIMVNGTEPKQPLMLMESSSSGNSQPILRLDHLGPLVVNSDGTLARIENWESLTDIERRNIERVLVRRNQQRLATLRATSNENP